LISCLLPVELTMVWRHDLSVLFQPKPLATSSVVKQDCLVLVCGADMPLNCASMRARCSGGILASASAGIGGVPLRSVTVVTSHRPGLALRGVTSAAREATAVRIAMLKAFFIIMKWKSPDKHANSSDFPAH
jgi:hypothetical protein